MIRYSAPLYANFHEHVRAKGVHASKGISPALVLTYPITDLEGDFVEPEGGQWVQRPYVNWEHDLPIGYAAKPVELMDLQIKGRNWSLPIGQTRFFQTAADLRGVDTKGHTVDAILDMARQAERLVGDDIVSGVSIEFKGLSQTAIGKSLLRNGGNAYRFHSWQGLGWAHCVQPVNPGAGRVVQDRVGKALKDRANQIHPFLAKSLQAAIGLKTTVTVPGADMSRIKKKAMEDDEYGSPADMGEETPPETEMEGDAPAKSVQAKYNLSQGVRDLVAAYLEELATSDNPKVKKDAQKFADKLTAVCDTVDSYADDLHSQLSGEGDSEPDADAEAEEPTPLDDDGSIMPKGLAKSEWKAVRVRIKASELKARAKSVFDKAPPGFTLIKTPVLNEMRESLKYFTKLAGK